VVVYAAQAALEKLFRRDWLPFPSFWQWVRMGQGKAFPAAIETQFWAGGKRQLPAWRAWCACTIALSHWFGG
jgi:hypothetical protein